MASALSPNPFDQFDLPKVANPFDQFDAKPIPSRLETFGTGTKEFGKSLLEGAIAGVGTGIAGLPSLDPRRPEYRQLAKYRNDFLRLNDMTTAERNTLADKLQNEDPISRRILFGTVKDLLNGDTRGAAEKSLRELQKPADIKDTTLYRAGKRIEEAAQADFGANKGWENSLTVTLGQGLGSVGTGVAASLLTGGAGAGAFFTAQGAGQSVETALQYDEQERAHGRPGLSDEDVAMAGILGTGPGATDTLPIEFLLGKIRVPMPFRRQLAKWIGKIGGQAAVEGIQEGSQQLLQNVIQQEVADAGEPATPTMAVEKPTGLVEQGNIDLTKRPIVKNADGTVSTVRSISVGIDGKSVLLPTVDPNGKILSKEDAIARYEKTGEHLGIFNNEKNANTYADDLHYQQDRYYSPKSILDQVGLNAGAGAGVGGIASAAEQVIEALAHRRGGGAANVSRETSTPESVPTGAAPADTLYPEPTAAVQSAAETPPVAPQTTQEAPVSPVVQNEAPATEPAPAVTPEAQANIFDQFDKPKATAADVTVVPQSEAPPSPLEIPTDVRAKLKEKGFTDEAIGKLTPTQANEAASGEPLKVVLTADERAKVLGEQAAAAGVAPEPTPKETDQAVETLKTEAAQPAAEIPAFSEDAAVAPPRADKSAGVYNFDPLDLRVDAKRFQFKSETDTEGVNATLKDVKNWRAERGNQIIVFQDKTGKLFVADGHQRTGLARRLIEQGTESDIRIPGVLFRESDGLSAEDVMGIAALKNIAEGSTSPVDAARVLRAVGPEALADLPMPREAVRTAVDLSKLGDESWRMVTNEVVEPNYAKYVGRFLPTDQPRQVAAMKALSRADPANEDEAAVLVRRVAASELAKGEAGSQTSMFGEEPDSTALEEVKIVAGAVRQLRGDRKLFSRLVREADRIEATGSKIERENAGAVVSQADRLSSVVETVAFRAGPVRDILTALAKEVKSGERSLAEARTSFVDALRREEAPAGEARAGAGTVERGPVQEARAEKPKAEPEPRRLASSSDTETGPFQVIREKTGGVVGTATTRKQAEDIARDLPYPPYRIEPATKPKAEPGAEGKPQLVLPGAEKLSDKELTQRRQAEEIARRQSAKKIAPKVQQKGVSDTGLFGEGDAQKRLLSSLERPVAPPFFSAVLRSVEGARLTKGGADQWMGYLKNQPGVKQDELDWLGVGDWLAGQGSVTKEALADFVRANQVEVKEVTRSDSPEDNELVAEKEKLIRENERLSRQIDDEIASGRAFPHEISDRMNENHDRIRDIEETQRNLPDESRAPKFASYQLPGGENYRELLLTLPSDSDPLRNYLRSEPTVTTEIRTEQDVQDARKYNANFKETAKGYSDAQVLEAIKEVRQGRSSSEDFRSSHWDEPNVLAHVRFNEREVNGKRVLFIEEVQSDWHQKGRKVGYQEGRKEAEQLKQARDQKEREYQAARDEWRAASGREREALYAKLKGIETEWTQAIDAWDKANLAAASGVPDAPFKTTWPELAMKRMIRWGAENGFDEVAWTPGDVQAERYDLSKQISKIKYLHGPDSDSGDLVAYDHAGKDVINRTAKPSELPDIIGKEAAERLLSAGQPIPRRRGGGTSYELAGVDLKVGGEGMKGFYDRILPSVANKLGKKFGAKVGEQHLPVGNADMSDAEKVRLINEHGVSTPAFDRARPKKTIAVHSLQITPAMREAAMQGQPLFRTEPESGKVRLSPEKRAVIEKQASAILTRIAGRGVRVKFEETIPLEGVVSPQFLGPLRASAAARGKTLNATIGGFYQFPPDAMVGLALNDPRYDPLTTIGHEAWHHVEQALLNRAEKATIAREMPRIAKLAAAEVGFTLEQMLNHPRVETTALAFQRYRRMKEEGSRLAVFPTPVRRVLEKVYNALRMIRDMLRRNGVQRFEDVFEAARTGAIARRDEEGQQQSFAERLASSADMDDPFAADGAEARKKAMLKGFEFQPIDRMLRLPFDIFGGMNAKGEWKPGLKISDKAARVITAARFDEKSRFAFLNPVMHHARSGLIDRYGLDDAYVARDRKRKLEERAILSQVPELMKMMDDNSMGAAEAQVLHSILVGETVPTTQFDKLSEPVRNAIDTFGAEAVELGLIPAESFERNRGKYLHRVYLKHENDQGGLSRWVGSMMTSRRKKIIGSELKGRGLWKTVPMGSLGDAPLKPGDKFNIFDQVNADGKVTKRVYQKFGAAGPAGYVSRGAWEVRGTKGGEIVLWRDYTKDERMKMGEITDARYTIAKTYMLMAHDLSVGRFYRDVSKNADWTSDTEPKTRWVEASDFSRVANASDLEWVHVPDTTIPKSQAKRYGALAGKYVRAEVWRDINEAEVLNKSNVWQKLLTEWKKMKTGRNPVVHMNNIMSNFVLMDMSGVGLSDFASGLRSLVKRDDIYREAEAAGAFGADLISQEVRQTVLQPILDDLEKGLQGGQGSLGARLGALGRLADGIWGVGKFLDRKMLQAYQLEDEVFRMAVYHRRRSQGVDAQEAADEARTQFIDYDIRAPWVNAARRSILPFISYTYRADPLVARTDATRPWKMAKYAAIAYAVQALSQLLVPGDDDEERRSMRPEEQGNTWLGAPRMIRMPWADEHGNPVYLDIRRWIPAGDIFDTNQGSSAVPIPAPLQLGGPLSMAFEFMLNKQAFSGDPITNDLTDDWWDKTSKTADWLYKSWMPSAAYVPGSWYWEKIARAYHGGRDFAGKPYSVAQAAASSVGVKLNPVDVKENFALRAFEFKKVEDELKSQMFRLGRDFARGLVTKDEAERQRNKLINKLLNLQRNRVKTFTGRELESAQ